MDLPTSHMIISILLNIIISFKISDTKILEPLQWTARGNCYVYFPSISTSFNVCNLKLPNGFGDREYYEVKDYRYTHVSNTSTDFGTYFYHFNIGAPVLSIDAICNNITSNPGYCANITGVGACDTPLKQIDGIAFAYQLRNNTETNTVDDCWRLSNQFGGPPQWSLYYAPNPTDGVKLSYANGDFLHDGPCPVNRKFSISFLCENEFLNVPDEEPLYETENCDYTLEIKSIYGCPIECKTYDLSLCNGEGLCGYDFTNMKPRCFCYDQYEGDDCSIYMPNEAVTAPSKELPTPSPNNIIHTFHTNNTLSDNGDIINITYDLSPMGLNGMAYQVTDMNPYKPYKYFIGIFQSIDVVQAGLPDACINLTINGDDRLPCTDIASDGTCNSFETNGRDYTGRTYAFQYDPSKEFCVYLGTRYDWQLYDDIDDPARGITINYKDGTWCGSRGINRGFRISLVCPDDDEEFKQPNINEETFVFEDTEAYCEYSMEFETTIACPYQCRTKQYINSSWEYSVCSGHGICAADPNAGFVRCLCDDGYIGVECSEIDSLKPTNDPTPKPSNKPTVKPTRYPTLSVKIHNVTIVERQPGSGKKTGGWIAGIVVLIVALIIFCVFGYVKYKKFKQREEVLLVELDKYQGMGNDERHNVQINKQGMTTFATIDDHIAKDTEEEEEEEEED